MKSPGALLGTIFLVQRLRQRLAQADTGIAIASNEAYRRVSSLSGFIGLIVLAGLCWAGLAGTQELPENILPTTFWVYVWVIAPLLCGLIGDFTSGANPYGYLAELGENLRAGRAVRAWATWLGWWLAVVLLALGTLAELVFNQTTTPRAPRPRRGRPHRRSRPRPPLARPRRDHRARGAPGEYPWTIAMVAYTSLSLWLLAQPLTATSPGSP